MNNIEMSAIELAQREQEQEERRYQLPFHRVDTITLSVLPTEDLPDGISVFEVRDDAEDALEQYKLDALVEDGSQYTDLCMECHDPDCNGCNN